MNRALKRLARAHLGEGQEALSLFAELEKAPAADDPVAGTAAASQVGPSTFYDEEGRFVPRCACRAYGTFGMGVSLRHGREGTWWCGPCWRSLCRSKGQT